MRFLLAAGVLVWSCGAALAVQPLPTEQAAQRLEEKQRSRHEDGGGPATRAEVEEMRSELKKLRAEVADLREEVARLRHREPRGSQPAPQPTADAPVRAGMTVAEVDKSIGQPGRMVGESGGVQRYEWRQLRDNGSALPLYGQVRDGKLVAFEWGELERWSKPTPILPAPPHPREQ